MSIPKGKKLKYTNVKIKLKKKDIKKANLDGQ